MSGSLGKPALSAQPVIDISLNQEQGRVDYSVVTHEGESTGINQLAEQLHKRVMEAMPKCATPTGAQQ